MFPAPLQKLKMPAEIKVLRDWIYGRNASMVRAEQEAQKIKPDFKISDWLEGIGYEAPMEGNYYLGQTIVDNIRTVKQHIAEDAWKGGDLALANSTNALSPEQFLEQNIGTLQQFQQMDIFSEDIAQDFGLIERQFRLQHMRNPTDDEELAEWRDQWKKQELAEVERAKQEMFEGTEVRSPRGFEIGGEEFEDEIEREEADLPTGERTLQDKWVFNDPNRGADDPMSKMEGEGTGVVDDAWVGEETQYPDRFVQLMDDPEFGTEQMAIEKREFYGGKEFPTLEEVEAEISKWDPIAAETARLERETEAFHAELESLVPGITLEPEFQVRKPEDELGRLDDLRQQQIREKKVLDELKQRHMTKIENEYDALVDKYNVDKLDLNTLDTKVAKTEAELNNFLETAVSRSVPASAQARVNSLIDHTSNIVQWDYSETAEALKGTGVDGLVTDLNTSFGVMEQRGQNPWLNTWGRQAARANEGEYIEMVDLDKPLEYKPDPAGKLYQYEPETFTSEQLQLPQRLENTFAGRMLEEPLVAQHQQVPKHPIMPTGLTMWFKYMSLGPSGIQTS